MLRILALGTTLCIILWIYPAAASVSSPAVQGAEGLSTLKFTAYFQTFENGFYYEAIADYLTRSLPGYAVKLVPSNSSFSGPLSEADNPLNPHTASEPVTLCQMCGGNYVAMDSKYLELSVAPTVSLKPEYYSYVVVPHDSTARSLDDLRGANVTFGVNEPHSLSGVMMLRNELRREYNISGDNAIEEFFGAPTYKTGGHFNSMEDLMKTKQEGRHIDVATIDSNFFYRGTVIFPKLKKRVRVVGSLGPYPMPPIVVAAWASLDLKRAIRDVLLRGHEDELMGDALKQCNFDRFVSVEDRYYNPVREALNLPLH